MNIIFRPLKADETECRVAQVTEKGVQLLIYKDARCDMNILDETVGAMNWQRTHSRDNANCAISIWDSEKNQWVSKEDTGTESNTEAEKGLASDSFKRAGTNWGIGRELYTAPFIWVSADKTKISQSNGKYKCYDKFIVTDMAVTDGKITALQIGKQNGYKIEPVYSYGTKNTITTPEVKPMPTQKPEARVEIATPPPKKPRTTFNERAGKFASFHDGHWFCVDCGKQFVEQTFNGTLFTEQMQSDNALKFRGARICKDCMIKRENEG